MRTKEHVEVTRETGRQIRRSRILSYERTVKLRQNWIGHQSNSREKFREEFIDDPYRKPTQVFGMSILRRVS